MLKINLPALTLAILAVHPSAQAAINWDFSPPSTTSPITSVYSGVVSTVSAFATGGTSSTTALFQSATAISYSGGIGVLNGATGESSYTVPSHAMDNNNGFEFALFSFTNQNGGSSISVALTSLAIGYKSTDADVSVLAYTGAGAPPSMTSKSISTLLTSGWTLVGNYANLATGDASARTINAGNISSSYWLIGGYYGSQGTTTSLNVGDDYFKISGLGGTFTPPPPSGDVPEPSSLVMLSLAFLAWRRYTTASKHSVAF